MSFSLRLCWTVVVAALMLLAVLGSARAQESQIQRYVAAPSAHAVDVQTSQLYGTARR